MKHIKCCKCGDLLKPKLYIDHFRRCLPEKANHSTDETDVGSQTKRQKISDDSEHVEGPSVGEENSNETQRPRTTTHRGDMEKSSTDSLKCSNCEKLFTRKNNLARHQVKCGIEKIKKTEKTACGKCKKSFSDYRTRLRHEKKCFIDKKYVNKNFTCATCGDKFSCVKDLTNHEKQFSHNRPGASGSSIRTPPGTVSPGGSESSTSTHLGYSVQNNKDNTSGATEKDISQTNPSCRLCGGRFANYRDLYHHRMVKHKQSGSVALLDDPWTVAEDIPPWQNEDGSENARLRNVYQQHRHLILRERVREGEVRSTYNFPVPNLSNIQQLTDQLEHIFEGNLNAFKVNLSFGLILQHVENGSYRYFAPHYTDSLFLFPHLISNRRDLDIFLLRLAKIDLSNYFQKQKPDSKWKPVLITNVLYHVHKTSFPLGLSQPLPVHITNSKSIVSFENNPNTGRLYTDNLCFFRCLAYHKLKNRNCEALCLDLHTQWLRYVKENHIKSSDVTLCKMPELEDCFQSNINVFELSAEKTVTILYKSRELFSNPTINLNLFSDHLSYISKFKSYASKFQCRLCKKLFDSKSNLTRHEKTCENATKIKFSGGYYNAQKSIFEKLANLGIRIESPSQNYPRFSTFDMEAMLRPVEQTDVDHLTKTSKHQPVSVSICSNVDGYTTPKFILNPDLDSLLLEMIGYMNEISSKAYDLAKIKWQYAFSALDKLENKWQTKFDNAKLDSIPDSTSDNGDSDSEEAMECNTVEPPSATFLHAVSKENVWYRFLENVNTTGQIETEYNTWENRNRDRNAVDSIDRDISDDSDDDDSDDDDSDDDDDQILRFQALNTDENISDDVNDRAFHNTSALMINLIRRIRQQFETYCHQLPVLGFNSAKYDLNLIKTKLSKHMRLHEPNQQKFVVKKNNSYMCLSNQTLRFLDMINYLPPGTSYDKFLSTFGVSMRKSYFPYEYFSDISVLDEKSLPPPDAFYSSLKQCNVLEDSARVMFERLQVSENKSETEALSILQLRSPPKSSILENYQSLLAIWEDNRMSTMKDFLEYYNNLDVLPMVEAVEKFKSYFVERGVDVFKDCISVPGAARKMLYKSGIDAGASFALIDKRDDDLYHTIKSNIVGGPSIIFTRYQEVDKTYIRENPRVPCKSVLGYDANSLYVHALSQPMPCGNYVRRFRNDQFKPSKSTTKYTVMYDWLEWLNHSQNLNIKHKMNFGSEKRVGPYLVDGFDSQTNTIFEFLGCYFHSHSCIEPVNEKLHKERYAKTQERLAYLRSEGFEIVSIWECEFRKLLREDHNMVKFVDQRYPNFYKTHKGRVTEPQILNAVLQETLFGFVEVDIRTPETWDQVEISPDTDLDPANYFEEMCPLFCTTEVEFDSIGEHMQEHASTYGLSTDPRTLLVGGLRAEGILLSTPLLKWYLEHGLLVSKIHQVVEFSKRPCFKQFVDTVTYDRRQGDVDKSQELKSSLSKLIGNSAFGGTIINQEKFQKIKYMEGFKKACFAVNDPRFKQLNELGDDMFESEFANANISINSPTYLGFMILQYAKLHMLSFYYDFMDKFVGREKFEMAEMDTDSCYFGLAESKLSDCVKPTMLSLFNRNLNGNCRDDFNGDQFKNVWFPRECCQKHKKHDTRTPGLMKLEFQGSKIVGLCSKSYVVINDKEGTRENVKYSLKGVNNFFLDPSDTFSRVLNTGNPVNAVNRGIRCFDNTVFTYNQPKQAFNYFYCKRKVKADGIHTTPLDIILRPINSFKQKQNEFEEELKRLYESLNT